MGEKHQKPSFVWQNGEIVPLEKATVNVLTPAVLFGANVFEGLAAYWNPEEEELLCFRFSTESIKANEFREDIHIFQVAYVADEVFLCGSGVEILPVVSLDRIPINDGTVGPVTQRIQTSYFDVVRGHHKGYPEWIVPAYKH